MLDTVTSELSPRSPRSHAAFSPRFDVREIGQEYQLNGEVPGFDQKELDIEFVDERTLVVRGRHASAESETADPSSNKYQAPSVEEGDDAAKESSEVATPARPAEPSYTYWVNERSEGAFERRFAFPGPVDQDGVRASLRNGILHIVVPKPANNQTRRIQVE